MRPGLASLLLLTQALASRATTVVPQSGGSIRMLDLIFVGGCLAFFAICALLVRFFEHI